MKLRIVVRHAISSGDFRAFFSQLSEGLDKEVPRWPCWQVVNLAHIFQFGNRDGFFCRFVISSCPFFSHDDSYTCVLLLQYGVQRDWGTRYELLLTCQSFVSKMRGGEDGKDRDDVSRNSFRSVAHSGYVNLLYGTWHLLYITLCVSKTISSCERFFHTRPVHTISPTYVLLADVDVLDLLDFVTIYSWFLTLRNFSLFSCHVSIHWVQH